MHIKLFVQKSPTLIHEDVYHSRLFPLLICNFPLQQWETQFLASAIHLLRFSVPVHMYHAFSIVNPYQYGVRLDHLEPSAAVQFPLPFVSESHSFPEFLGSAPLPPLFSVRFFPYISSLSLPQTSSLSWGFPLPSYFRSQDLLIFFYYLCCGGYPPFAFWETGNYIFETMSLL